MAEFGINLNFDDGGLAERLNKNAELFDKLAAEVKDLDTQMKATGKSSVAELSKVQNETAGLLSTFSKTGESITKAFTASKEDIGAVAAIIAKNTQESDKLLDVYDKLITAKNQGILLDADDVLSLANGFDQFAQTLGLTQEELDTVQLNLEEVVNEINRINAQPIAEAAALVGQAADETEIFEQGLKNLADVNIKELQDKLQRLAVTSGTNTDEFKETAQAIGEYKARLTEADRAVEFYAKSSDALSTALGELEDRMYDLALAGKQNTQEYKDLLANVVRMKNAIVDTDKQVDRLVDKKTGFATFAENVQLLGAGFQVVEGASALFGDENEDLQKTLVKLNAVMAITSALEQARTVLLEQSRAKTGAAAAAQAIYTTVVGASSGALKVFRLALAATGIGLFVILLGALVANWDKIKKSVDDNSKSLFEYGKKVTFFLPPLNLLIKGIEFLYNNFDRLDNIASGVIDGVVAGLGAVGDVIGRLFSGDFSGAYEAAKQVGAKIGAATKEGIEAADKADANLLVSKEIDGIVANQKKKLEIMAAGGKDTANLQKNILANELKALRLANADKEAIAEKEQEILVFNAERQKDAAEKAKAAREKQIAEAKKAYDDYISDLNKINDEAKNAKRASQVDAIDDSSIRGQIERLQLQQQFDREDLEERKRITLEKVKDAEQRANLVAAFKDLEIQLSAQANQELNNLERKAREQYNKIVEDNAKETDEIVKKYKKEEAKKRLEDALNRIQVLEEVNLAEIERELKYGELSISQREELERQKLEIILNSLKAQRAAFGLTQNEETFKLDSLIKDAESEINKFDKDLNNLGLKEKFDKFLQDSFGIDPEQFEALAQGFGALKNAVLDVVNAGYEAEILALDESISKREDRISDLEGLIEDELDAKNKGYANDYDALIQQKAEEETLLKEDNKKRLEIQKEQLKNETAIQAAQQVGALVTAVANMVASGSKLGIFGLPLIAASVIGLFALYKNYKNQVKALSTSAFKGGKISDYLNPGERAKSDRPGYGEGHRVEGTNLRIGADEFLINAVTTSKHLPFLKEFNKGSFDNVDFMKAISRAPDKSVLVKVVRDQEAKDKKESRKKVIDNYKESFKQIIREQTDEILEMERKKPIVIPLPNGDVEIINITKNGSQKRIVKKA